jgi:phytoene dehydrogenase-like protein
MMEPIHRPVVIIGGGLAGLACALYLKRNGIAPLLLESADRCGGRVMTDDIEGFKLDRGFQIMLTSYPEAQRLLDFDKLNLQRFRPGAIVRFRNSFHKLADPFRVPLDAMTTLTARIGNLKDKYLVGQLSLARKSFLDDTELRRSLSHAELQRIGFSQQFIDSFFAPFFGGIFLERRLDSNAAMMRHLFQLFASGDATVPNDGMVEIANQLSAQLLPEEYRLNAAVKELHDGQVILVSGEVIPTNKIVVATDWVTAAKLLNQSEVRKSRSVCCLYYAAEERASGAPFLYLNSDPTGTINNMCFISSVAPGYAPKGKSLVSVSVLGNPGTDDVSLEAAVRRELLQWFGDETRAWTHLRTYRIPHALPDQSPEQTLITYAAAGKNIFICGDYTENASIDGALRSGRLAAERIIQQGNVAAA